LIAGIVYRGVLIVRVDVQFAEDMLLRIDEFQQISHGRSTSSAAHGTIKMVKSSSTRPAAPAMNQTSGSRATILQLTLGQPGAVEETRPFA
jgi:hypothetical protein